MVAGFRLRRAACRRAGAGDGRGIPEVEGQLGRSSELHRIESVQAAKDSTIKLLSYKPDSVEQQLNAARGLLDR